MKKWAFRMESVLQVRTRAEEAASQEFSAALRKLASVEELIASFQRKLTETAEGRMQGKSVAAGEHQNHGSYWEHLQKEMSVAASARDAAVANVERARQTLLFTQQEKKAIEKLREKEFKFFSEGRQKSEQAEADDLCTVRFINQAYLKG